MRKSKLADSQIMAVLKRVEAGEAVPDLCRELTISTVILASGAPSTAAWMHP